MGRDERNTPALGIILCNQLVSELEAISTTLNKLSLHVSGHELITVFSHRKKIMFSNYQQDWDYITVVL